MLKPHKYTDLDHSILAVSTKILEHLVKKGRIDYDHLDEFIIKKAGKRSLPLVAPAINFLFLVGLLDYDEITDSFFIPK